MVKLNRTTEYGLIALKHMNQKALKKDLSVTSAREVSDRYKLPFEITAKTLLRMKDMGLIQSEQGARGGYVLKRDLEGLSLADFLKFMEGPQGVVGCSIETQNACACEYESQCEIKDSMIDLNQKVQNFLSTITLSELMQPNQKISAFIGTPALEQQGQQTL